MVNRGWIKLYRDLRAKSIWQLSSPPQKVVLITILLLANHEESKWEWKGEQFICRPGQLITSLSSLVKECGDGVTIRNVRTSLDRFEKLGFLTNTSTKTGRLLTIVNWDKYQGYDFVNDNGSSKELTKSRQRADKEPTPNKNIRTKEYKNEKKGGSICTPPTLNEIKLFCLKNGYELDCEKFFNHYESVDWKNNSGNYITNWKAKIKYWIRQDSCKTHKQMSYQERTVLEQEKAREKFLKGE